MIMPISLVVGLVSGAVIGWSVFEDMADAPGFGVGEAHAQWLEGDAEYTVWSTNNSGERPVCAIADPADREVIPHEAGTETNTVNSIEYTAGLGFRTGEAGNYTFYCQSASRQDVFAVTKPIAGRVLGSLLGGLGLGSLCGLTGVALIIVYIVKRSRWSREVRAAGAAAYYPQGQAYPAGGYQAPGYQAAGYQAPGYQAPGYQASGQAGAGYQAPGYQAPGYQAPGYQAPGYQAPGYQGPPSQGQGNQSQADQAQTQPGQQGGDGTGTIDPYRPPS
jgi:hypothetical protein